MRRTERSLFSVASACGMWGQSDRRRQRQAGAVREVVVGLELVLVLKQVRTLGSELSSRTFCGEGDSALANVVVTGHSSDGDPEMGPV